MALFAALLGLFGASAAAAYFMDIAFAASPPPAPSITSSPSNPTTSTSATFVFKDSQSGVTFKCALDTSTFTTCSSPISYSSLAQGSHTFKVEAVSTCHELCDFLHVVDRAPHPDDHLGTEQPHDEHDGHVQVLRHPCRSLLQVLT